ncbi:ParB N-terminal domain-containing protein [Vibrio vulnificus]|nr:ParB N-terminal domain-containing protein [Vibrio vulnificus]
MKTVKLKLDKIKIPEQRLRPVDKQRVHELSKSIHALGLISPIIVSKGKVLIAGAHRVEACRLLGHREIEARIALTDDDARLIEIDENLIRHALKPAERKEHALKRIDEIKLRIRDEAYEEAVQESVDNGNLSPDYVEETLAIARGLRPIEEASKPKVAEVARKAMNRIDKLAIEIAEGEFGLTKRYIRDAMREASKAKIEFDTVDIEYKLSDFKATMNKRLKSILSEFKSELINYEDQDGYDELCGILKRFEEVQNDSN